MRFILFFCHGNSNKHLKNFSLIENNGVYVLSKAYDLLPVNVIFPENKEEFTLTLNGKKANIMKKRFCYLCKRMWNI